ncbi:methyltransferase family protein [Haloactinopolyspora alba]|uniref:Methyltransferase family protein n=1 Tax=Haloactinopolyspora alba TaxID=648780 RepID=A0A2P8DZ64_9ACTN|nr:class I SAM-dependent methyltransferase [Haloactinopolyspora alba]PSL02513.1 methyltransferase family protein [Haloactinopolyspora alba]
MSQFGALTARLYGWVYGRSKVDDMVVELAGLSPRDRVLEVGCGPGTAVARAAERIGASRVAAVDPSATFVRMARNRVPDADVRVAGAESLPFTDRSFDAIWSIASMHHWADRDAGLRELTAKLAPSGRLLVAERLLSKTGHGITIDQAAEVTALLTELGHTDVRTEERRSGRITMMIIRSAK